MPYRSGPVPKVAQSTRRVSFTDFPAVQLSFSRICPNVSVFALLSPTLTICLHHSQSRVWSSISSHIGSLTCDWPRALGGREGRDSVSKSIYTSQVQGCMNDSK
jgi:hypothetical protein